MKVDKNRVIVITGCDSGIGLELAKRALDWGFQLVACCLHVDSHGAQYLKSKNAEVIRLDVLEEDSVLQLHSTVRQLIAQDKELHGLVNNAGVMTYAPAEWHTWSLIEDQLKINLSGPMQVTRVLLPFLRHSKGRIINVSSPQGLMASPFMTPYCSSKAGLDTFSRALRREVSRYGIKVVTVMPGDLSNQTTILSSNANHLESMWSNMAEDVKSEYHEEFEAMKKTFAKYQEVTESSDIRDKYIFDAFRSAITSTTPEYSYIAGPPILRIFLSLIQVIPETWTDFLITHKVAESILLWSRN